MSSTMTLLSLDRRRFLSYALGGFAAGAVHGLTAGSAFAQDACARLAATSAQWNTAVRPMLASRYHRLQHCMFHYVRNNWPSLSPAQQKSIAALNWATPRGSMDRGAWDKGKPYSNIFWATANNSGEDFLYYHRWMILMVDQALAKYKVGPIEPWSGTDTIPPPLGGCSDEQIPDFSPAFENAQDGSAINVPWLQMRVKEMKEPTFFWGKLNWWGQDFRDRAYLKTMTLGELGSRLESGVHNQMHIRWSAYPSNGMRLIRDESDFRPKWDDPGYDTLFDEYSSHITPNFFRLHKWIDNRIEDWAEAHGTAVERTATPHGFDWFRTGEWVKVAQPWTGAWGFEPISQQEETKRIAVMEAVTRVLFPQEAVMLRFTSTDSDAREREQRRILSLRDPQM
jgi:hypothetical protein